MKKKILALALVLLLTVLPLMTSCQKSGKYTVGVCQLVQHPALDAATEGFVQALKDKLGEENVEILVQNAANSVETCGTIVNDFVSRNVDLIMANATPALQAAANATETIPILGTSVTEYGVALGIDNFTGLVGSNISGTSDLAPLDQQAEMLTTLFPEAKNVGLLYCASEPNSVYQVKKISEFLAAKGITCAEYKFSDSNDVIAVTELACASSDVIYVPTDNTAAACAETIGNVVREKDVPVIAGEEGICTGCGVATLSISYYDLGYKTGEMAAAILTREQKVEEMKIGYVDKFTKKYNKSICDDIGYTMPESVVADYTVIGE